MNRRLNRRSLVAGIGMVSAVLVAACSSGTSTSTASTAAPAQPASSSSAAPTTAAAKPASAANAAPAAAPTAAPQAQATTGSAQKIQMNWWTHGAEEVNKKKMLGILVDTYHTKHPNETVTITWTQMPGIWQQLQAAFTADSGYPDIFWFDRTHGQWAVAGWVADLTNGITWSNLADWGKVAGLMPGPDGKDHIYLYPEYASTGELYYNKQMFKDFGISVPASAQFSEDEFKTVVQTVTGKGVAAFANANGDRTTPGQNLATYLLLSKLGQDDMVKLYKGQIPWTDPRVVAVFDYFEQLVKLHAYPTTFSSMTLSESHHYFHTEHKAAMFPCPSWYTARAFVPVDQGGQPADFQLGFLEYPAMKDGQGTKQKYLAPGGAQTASAKSKYRDQAIAVVNGYTDVDWATQWVGVTSNPTAVKIDSTKIKSNYPSYWNDYFHSQDGYTMVVNSDPSNVATPGQYDVWVQVVSSGLAGGLLSSQQAIQQLDAGWKKNAK